MTIVFSLQFLYSFYRNFPYDEWFTLRLYAINQVFFSSQRQSIWITEMPVILLFLGVHLFWPFCTINFGGKRYQKWGSYDVPGIWLVVGVHVIRAYLVGLFSKLVAVLNHLRSPR